MRVVLFFGGVGMAVFRASSWLFIRRSPLADLRKPYEFKGSKPGQAYARQAL